MMMGIFLGAMGDMSPAIPIVNGREAPQAPATEQVGITRSRYGGSRLVTAYVMFSSAMLGACPGRQLRIAYRATFDRCGHWARNFMVLTGRWQAKDSALPITFSGAWS